MNENLFSALQTLVSEQGESVLADSRRVGGYLADFAAREPKAQRKAFVRCLELGFYAQLRAAPEAERPTVKGRLAQRLHDDEGFDLALCAASVELLEAVMFGKAAEVPSSDDWVTVEEARAETQPGPAQEPASPEEAERGAKAAKKAAWLIAARAAAEEEAQAEEAAPRKKRLVAWLIAAVVAAAVIGGIYWYNGSVERQADAAFDRGNDYAEKKDYDRAIAEYTEAIRLKPDAAAYNNRGSAYFNGKKDYGRAIADFEAALRINPNNEMAKNNLSIAKSARGW